MKFFKIFLVGIILSAVVFLIPVIFTAVLLNSTSGGHDNAGAAVAFLAAILFFAFLGFVTFVGSIYIGLKVQLSRNRTVKPITWKTKLMNKKVYLTLILLIIIIIYYFSN